MSDGKARAARKGTRTTRAQARKTLKNQRPMFKIAAAKKHAQARQAFQPGSR